MILEGGRAGRGDWPRPPPPLGADRDLLRGVGQGLTRATCEALTPPVSTTVPVGFDPLGRVGDGGEYLQAIGVGTEMHRQGIGSRLLRRRLSLIDAAGSGAYLESSTDQTSALYRRHGFIEIGPVTGFPGEKPPTAMWREPAPPAR